jgi:divalent metal cation (Fe/Co/Zn/Cd) transporter
VAAVGISVAYVWQKPIFDAIASIMIGLVLLVLALFLAYETKELLIGESATKKDRETIREVIGDIPEIRECGNLLTMHMGPNDILVNIEVEFVDDLSTDEVEAAVDRIESRIKQAVPAVTKIYIEAQAVRKKLAEVSIPVRE